MKPTRKPTQNESIFFQALAMTSLLIRLDNINFLESEYYQNLRFSAGNESYKQILNESGLGNPATMQMFLYILLVMPKEILGKFDDSYMEECEKEINELFSRLINNNINVNTNYKGESPDDLTSINFYRHTRNAVAHSRCYYGVIDNVSYVTFKDEGDKQQCEFTLKTADIGYVVETLQRQIIAFLNKSFT